MTAPPRPLLYTHRRCPYAMRARMALLLAGTAFDAHEIVWGHKPKDLLAASPKGTVPVLVLPDGQVIDQSWDIVQWALTRPGLDPSRPMWWHLAQTDGNRELLHLNDGVFKQHLDGYKYPERHSPKTDPTSVQATREHHRHLALTTLLLRLEQRLAAAPFLGGQTPCATDLGIFPFVRQFAAVDAEWFTQAPLHKTAAWLAHWQQSPLFEVCMQKLPSDQVVAFGLPPESAVASSLSA